MGCVQQQREDGKSSFRERDYKYMTKVNVRYLFIDVRKKKPAV